MNLCRIRTHENVCEIFNTKYGDRNPIVRGIMTKIIKKIEENGHVWECPKSDNPANKI